MSFAEDTGGRDPTNASVNGYPDHAYTATLKAHPSSDDAGFDQRRVRFDRVDESGKVSLRRAGKMHRLGIGRTHARQRVIILTTEDTITVTHRTTEEVLSEQRINPEKRYCPER